jgi:hypothetical protein
MAGICSKHAWLQLRAAAQEGRVCLMRHFSKSQAVTLREGGANGGGNCWVARVGNIDEAMAIAVTTTRHYLTYIYRYHASLTSS